MVKLLPTIDKAIFINPKHISSIEVKEIIDSVDYDYMASIATTRVSYRVVAFLSNGKEVTLALKETKDEAYGFIGEFADFIGG